MLNELQLQLKQLTVPGDRLTCAVSGGADSMALLWGAYLLKDRLGISLEAAHFNHRLRGEESDRDEAFVREFCQRYEIPLTVGRGQVTAGKKGLEAAAREARYAFLREIPGKLATAHTADDNAETVLINLIRGTGLRGLGGIAQVNGRILRPMLGVTRQQVEAFLEEYHISHVEDSSNQTDDFLRNRLRHRVMPLLKEENPRLAENLSAMARSLREDAQYLDSQAQYGQLPPVSELVGMPAPVRDRMLEAFLKENGIHEPQREHIALAVKLLESQKPSARACLPGGVVLQRNYDTLEMGAAPILLTPVPLPVPGSLELPEMGLRVTVKPAEQILHTENIFTVVPQGPLVLRSRQSGDRICLSGGTKTLKKLFIDRKIPAALRYGIPVIADDEGILGVYGIGADQSRKAQKLPAIQIRIERYWEEA